MTLTNPASVQSRLLLIAFTAAVFTSAALLFAIQPMFTRMVLPVLGGAPSVWSVAMVFFQSALLAGYAYAHALVRTGRLPIIIAIHLTLTAVAGLTLPLAVARAWQVPSANWPALWLLGTFAVSIGLPFCALAANAPLLQAWFARTHHPNASDPYFLYAASNIGSFLALLSYPLVLEPLLPLAQQSLLWSIGFWLLFALNAGCGYLLLQNPALPRDLITDQASGSWPNWRHIGLWLFLAAVPSGLLVAVTAHISTDIAAAPLLWVVPLALYLLTFVLAFAKRPLLSHRFILRLLPFTLAALVLFMAPFPFGNPRPLIINVSGHLLAFFLIALACHGELSRRRPPAEYLTTFYLSLALGGMIGGIFAGLIAPNAFSWVAEYPMLIVMAALCLPFASGRWNRKDRIFWIVAISAAIGLLAPSLFGDWTPSESAPIFVYTAIAALAIVAVRFARDPPKLAFTLAVALAMVWLYPDEHTRQETIRSFFGVHKIYNSRDGRYRVLMHGTTIHGAQRVADDKDKMASGSPEPLTYYHSASPLAEAIKAVRERKNRPLRVAVIGLGAGSLACYFSPGDDWRFFEIDPSVIAIARDRFAYLRSCAPVAPIVPGDARLTLASEPGQYFDVIVIDAYSSDAIPVHLATQEAMALYRSKLAADGVVLMHISSRHFELATVVAGIASANGMRTWVKNEDEDKYDDNDPYIFASEVSISATGSEDIGSLATNDDWELIAPPPDQRVWTDDYSNVLGAITRRWKADRSDQTD